MKDCNVTYPPTPSGFRQMNGHQLKHANDGVPKEKRGFHLEDENTGEVLARSVKEAMPFFTVETPTPTTPPKEVKPTPTPPLVVIPELKEPEKVAETEEKGEVKTVKTAGIFTYEITLPADAYTLFNLAKATGLEPNDGKHFDEWVWDCIRARYSKDYKKQLILAPLEE